MIAVCLPTLRPMFLSWSLERTVRSVRSATSLRSPNSDHRPFFTAKGTLAGFESETAFTGSQQPGLGYRNQSSFEAEANAMGEMDGEKAQKQMAGPDIFKEAQVLENWEVI